MAAGVSGSHSHNLPVDVEIVVTLVRKTHTYTNVYTATEIAVTVVQQTNLAQKFRGESSMTVGASITSDLQI